MNMPTQDLTTKWYLLEERAKEIRKDLEYYTKTLAKLKVELEAIETVQALISEETLKRN